MKCNKAYLALTVCWLFYLFSYFARVEPSVLVNELMSEFSFTSSKVGWIISVMYIPYLITQIPSGILSDKLGYRLVITICCTLCSLGVVCFGLAQNSFQLMCGRFLIGLASAPAFLCCGKVAAALFRKEKYGMLMGLAMCMGCIGGIFGTNVSAMLTPIFGWRKFTLALAIVGLVIGFCSYFFIKEDNKDSNNKNESIDLLKGLKILVKDSQVWLIGLYGAMSYLPLGAIAELWGVPFLQNRFSVSTSKASFCTALMFISFGFGSIVSAWAVEKIKSYKITILSFSAILFISFWFAIYNNTVDFSLCVLLFSLGSFCAGANTLCFPMCYDKVPSEYAGTSGGFMNMVVMSSGIIFQPLLGKLLDFFRNGQVNPDGSPLYNTAIYRSTFSFVMLGLFIALLSAFFFKEKRNG